MGAVWVGVNQRDAFGVKLKCITHRRPIGWHCFIHLHHFHSAPPAEAYSAPFIMHAQHPPAHWPVMAGSLRQLCSALLWPLRGCKQLHNLEGSRCFQSSSLIKNGRDSVSGGVLPKVGNGKFSSGDNACRHGPQLFKLSLQNFWRT